MFYNSTYSLEDLLGSEYVLHASMASAQTMGMTQDEALQHFREKVEFWPEAHESRIRAIRKNIGTQLVQPFEGDQPGATTDAFRKVSRKGPAPLGGIGPYRLGENGRVYLAAKSEHYHIPLGHNFPGYRLLAKARSLGIPNATHNNTRGYITRLLEQKLVAAANGIAMDDKVGLRDVLHSQDSKTLNRVLNLETGSLAVEAGMKMMLARFYRQDHGCQSPKYAGKTPVFLVMQDYNGGFEANYHGTTVLAQTFRGLWPDLYEKLEQAGVFKIVPVAINDTEDFREKLERYNTGNYKTAGFLHEIVLMNYGGILLDKAYLQEVYRMCADTDTPCLADEIQSCAWCPEMLLFRQYEIRPDIVVVGKGFPGGENAASRVIINADMDRLVLFGALITNGQEEISSLSYLITMRFMEDNAQEFKRLGQRFQQACLQLVEEYPDVLTGVEGHGYLAALHFSSVEQAGTFAHSLSGRYIDTSAQLYKANCPPAALFKLPMIMQDEDLDILLDAIRAVLCQMRQEK